MTIIVVGHDGNKRTFTDQPDELEAQLMDDIAAGKGISLTNTRKIRVNYGPGRISYAIFKRVIDTKGQVKEVA